MAAGGKREGAGRKSVAEEQTVKALILSALKSFYSADTDDNAKEKLIHTLLESQRGQIFVSEHLFGKPKETVDQNLTVSNFNIKDLISFGNNK